MAELVYTLHIREDLRAEVTRTKMSGFGCDFAVISIEYDGKYKTCYAITIDDYEVFSVELTNHIDALDINKSVSSDVENALKELEIEFISWEELK